MPETATKAPATSVQAGRKTSKASWKKSKVHENITTPSGSVISLQIPNLPALVRAGQLPNHLIEVATGVSNGSTAITPELFGKQAEFTNKLVSLAVVDPELTEEEVEEVVPYEDQEFIVEIATRQRDLDAVGRHIGGLHTQDEFRKFRNLTIGDEGLPSF